MSRVFFSFLSCLCVLAALALVEPEGALAEMIVLRGEGAQTPQILRGRMSLTPDGQVKITLPNGETRIVPHSDILAVLEHEGTPRGSEPASGTGKMPPIESKPPVAKEEMKVEAKAPEEPPPIERTGPDTMPEDVPEAPAEPEMDKEPEQPESQPKQPESKPEREKIELSSLPGVDNDGEGKDPEAGKVFVGEGEEAKSASGFMPLVVGATWKRNKGLVTHTIVDRKELAPGLVQYREHIVERRLSGTEKPPNWNKILVQEEAKDGRTFKKYYRDDSSENPLLFLVEPVVKGTRWKIGNDWRVVTDIDASYTDSQGVAHEHCVVIGRQDAAGKTIAGGALYFAPGKGEVSDNFVSFEKK